jgi:uncharacterized phage protein (TIGR02218 family)
MQKELLAHLQTGSTTVCRAWLVKRRDGEEFGFTDHDESLMIDGVNFSAHSGFTAQSVEKTLGMAVDNTEVTGALSDSSLSELDIVAGRYDGAEVTALIVNWQNPEERSIVFKGSFGEITRSDGAFRVELRGLSEALNVQRGRIYQPECSASLGDHECKVDLSAKGMTIAVSLVKVEGRRFIYFNGLSEFDVGWFKNGRATIVTGNGIGQIQIVKEEEEISGLRRIELWQAYGQAPSIGDEIQLIAGCDKRASICRQKFSNFLNFRGFPHIPGDDWLRSGPNATGRR